MAKQITLLFLCFSFCAVNALSQVQTKGMNLYERALSACVTKQLKDYGTQNSETHLRLSNRIIEYDLILTEKLPTQFGDIKVEYLTKGEIAERYKNRKTEIPVTIIRPMKNDGKTLKISFSDYYVSYKKRSYNQALEGGCIVDFNFDNQLDDFAITKVDLWGV